MKKIFPVAVVLLFSLSGLSQSTRIAASKVLKESFPEAAGFDPNRLTRIDKVLQEYVDKKWVAGGSAIVVHNGSIVYYKAFGYDDIDIKKPEKKDAIFRIASQTKAITSVAIMMLYEQGKFLLDDPVSSYIPEYKNPRVLDKFNEKDTTYTTVPAKREITIRDLLTHTSGIGYAQIGTKTANAIYYKNGISSGIGVGNILLADKMKKLGSLPLFHQPGEKWTYGLNTDLLGYLVEVVSGMSLSDFFQKNIFEPLGMKDTYFYLPKNKYDRLATIYTEDSTYHVIKTKKNFDLNGTVYVDYPATQGTYFSGGGGLSSTAYDYAIFMQMLLNGGEYNGKRILSRNSINLMTQNQIGDLRRGDDTFGLGFGITTERGASKTPVSAGTYDWGGAFSSSYWIDPKEKIVAQLFLNQFPNSHNEIHKKFKVLVYQALK
ncbi:MAG: beta-lactamase family protein [Bacteroidetes bacterium]|nr:beta-lactamase family protein [Bacteroidota bacterium]MBS1631871.1 beta-lactamase family protein [Bacteroidota bacterium]